MIDPNVVEVGNSPPSHTWRWILTINETLNKGHFCIISTFPQAFLRLSLTSPTLLPSPKLLSLRPDTLVNSVKTCSVLVLLRPQSDFPSCGLDEWGSRKEILFSRLNVQFYTFPLSCFSSVMSESLKCSSCPSALSCRFALICATCYFKCHVSHCGYSSFHWCLPSSLQGKGKGWPDPKSAFSLKEQ